MTTTWPEGGGFHLADGLFFTRLDDGGVLIRFYPGAGRDPRVEALSIRCTPEQWASVVASMQRSGETHATWQAALEQQKP